MSKILPPVVATLIADTKEFTAKMNEAEAKMAKLDAAGASTASKFGKSALLYGAAAGVIVGGVAEIGKQAIESGMKFQDSLTRVRTASGMTAQETKALGDALLGTAGKSEFSAKEMVDAYKGVAGQLHAMNGEVLTTAQSTEFLRTATELSTASGNALNATTQDLVTVMRAYGKPVEHVAKVSDALFKTSQITGVSMDSLAQTLQRMHMRLGTAAPSISDTTALLADFTQNGIAGDRAIRAVSGSITKLLDPTSKVSANFAQMTGKSLYVNGQFIGMRNVIGILHNSLAGLTSEQQAAAMSTLGLGSNAQALLKVITGGQSTWDKGTSAIKRHKNALQGANAQQQTLEGQLKTFKSAWSDFVTTAGVDLLPTATKVTKWANTVFIPALETLITGKPVYGKGGKETTPSRVSEAVRAGAGGLWNIFKGAMDVSHVIPHVLTGQFGRAGQDIGAAGRALGRTEQYAKKLQVEVTGGTTDPVWKHDLQVAKVKEQISIREAGRLGFRPGAVLGIDKIKPPIELKRGSKVEVVKVPKAHVKVSVNGKTKVSR